MTDLIIDGKQVVLPKGMDLKVKQQNPLITKNGTFTLDLSLSLKERNNSILYKHIERLQSAAVIEGRSAILISNGHVILNGTEAFISNTNEEVKIQLLSGNSELNYFIGANSYISSLDLGKENDLSNEHFNKAIRNNFPDYNFTCPMVKIGNIIYNKYYEMERLRKENLVYDFTNRAIQPYLLGMIEKILKALGYTIELNEARNDQFLSHIFILNNDTSGEYNKILPGWTVKEFLEECERLMNIVFVINDTNKSARILCAYSPNDLGTYTINNVLDTFERTAVDSEERISYKNVCYDFPSSNEYKYLDIDNEIIKTANVIEVENYSELIERFTDAEGYFFPDELFEEQIQTLNIWYVKETDCYYIPEKRNDHIDNLPQDPTKNILDQGYLFKVNAFKKYTSEPDNDYLELGFFPCTFTRMAYAVQYGGLLIKYPASLPYQPGNNQSDAENEIKTIKSLIENGVTDFDKNKKQVTICACFPKPDDNDKYVAFTDHTPAHIFRKSDCTKLDIGSFRLDGPNSMIQYFRPNQNIDTTKEYTIKFITSTMPNIQAQFLLNNKLFICKELEYRIINDGIHPEVTGTFYEIK